MESNWRKNERLAAAALGLSAEPETEHGEVRMEYEILLTSKSKLVLKRTHNGVVAVELLKAGYARDGHGWIWTDGCFLDEADIEQMLAFLGAESTRQQNRQKTPRMLATTSTEQAHVTKCDFPHSQTPCAKQGTREGEL